ncbi:MAG: hypothetical protein WC683_07390 [bacterium]
MMQKAGLLMARPFGLCLSVHGRGKFWIARDDAVRLREEGTPAPVRDVAAGNVRIENPLGLVEVQVRKSYLRIELHDTGIPILYVKRDSFGILLDGLMAKAAVLSEDRGLARGFGE